MGTQISDTFGVDFSRDETYSIAMLLLFIVKDHPRYSTISELSTILDHESFVRFIKYYEGQTITIPTIEEVSRSLKILMMYQYYCIENIPWYEAITMAGFKRDESASVKRSLSIFKKSLDKYEIGDLYDEGEVEL